MFSGDFVDFSSLFFLKPIASFVIITLCLVIDSIAFIITRLGIVVLSSSDDRTSLSSGFFGFIVFVYSYVGTSIRSTYVEKASFFASGFSRSKKSTINSLIIRY